MCPLIAYIIFDKQVIKYHIILALYIMNFNIFMKHHTFIQVREDTSVCPNNLYFYSFIFYLLRAVPLAYGSSQARDRIGAVPAGPHHSHSKEGSRLHL